MPYKCRLCGLTVDAIPEGSIELSSGSQIFKLWRFKSGEVHDLRRVRTPKELQRAKNGMARGAHKTHHLNKGITKKGCKFCEAEWTNNSVIQS